MRVSSWGREEKRLGGRILVGRMEVLVEEGRIHVGERRYVSHCLIAEKVTRQKSVP